jgi:hypothetical protein
MNSPLPIFDGVSVIYENVTRVAADYSGAMCDLQLSRGIVRRTYRV